MDYSPETLKHNVQFIASGLGFSDCRIAPVMRAPHADQYLEWIAQGMHGDMSWFERNNERRTDPREILPDAQAMICLALNYNPAEAHPNPEYRIAKYSWNDDYHDLIESKLKDFDLTLSEMGGRQRFYVDTGPVLERDFATESGLGWSGKSSVQIHQKLGTWFFLAEIITTLPLQPDGLIKNRCGTCSRCMDYCPTNAIIAPHKVDARKCISYLTIEHKGAIPVEYRKAIGNRIYGCDECLEVCPWNKFAQLSQEATFLARESVFEKSLNDFLDLTEDDFRALFAKSPIKRIKHNRFIRNVCVALGNVGTERDLIKLKALSESEDPLISEHASWAVSEIEERVLAV